MVRGGKQLLPWCRALSRQCDTPRAGNNIPTTSNVFRVLDSEYSSFCSSVPSCYLDGGRFVGSGCFSTVADPSDVGRKSSGDEPLFPQKGDNFPTSQFSATNPGQKPEDGGYFGTDFSNVESQKTFSVSPRTDATPGRGIYFPASQAPGVPPMRVGIDRNFRARNNSAVANMLKLLEASTSQDDVEKILEDHISEFTESSRWPWLPLLDALQRGPKPYLSLEVFNWKKDRFDGGDPREYAKMISTAGKLSQLEIAVDLFKEMERKGVKRSPVTCNALMSAYSKNDQVDEAVAVFKEMLEKDDCKPTLVTYNTVISMYSKLSIPDMEHYFNLCKSSGFYPDRVTFNSMIWGYMRARDFAKMEEMYEELKKSGCKPDPITFSALIIGFSKANDTVKMELAFSHMQEEGFPISTMVAEILTEVYALDKKFEKLERILKITTNTPGATCSSRIYGFAIQSYADSDRIREMEETMEKMFTSKRLFTSAKTLESVISAYGNRAQFDQLDLVLQRIKSMGWSYQESTFHALLFQFGKGREFEKMEEVFKEMKDAADVQPTEETYKIMADSYHSAGNGDGLKKTVDRMSAAGFSTSEVINKEVDQVWTDDEIFGGKRR